MRSDRKLFELLKKFTLFAGKLSLPYYGKIETRYKKIEISKAMHESPVTIIDHAIQELLLAELVRKGITGIGFSGEEEKTHLEFFFNPDLNNGTVLHADPIDGTLAFTRGVNRFAIGTGLSRAKKGMHDFFATTIYSPLEKRLYAAYEDEKIEFRRAESIPRTIATRELSEAGKEAVSRLGYELVKPGSGHLATTDVALGKMGACIGQNIETHDCLVPFAFARKMGVIPVDNVGKRLTRFHLKVRDNRFERIPEINYFATNEIREELLPILQDKKNLK